MVSASKLTIINVNPTGLGNMQKLTGLLLHLESWHPDVICLSDTRFNEDSEKKVMNLINFDCFFNSFNSQSRGVAILIKKSTPISVIGTDKDNDGNFIALKCLYESKEFIISCVYGPNRDEPIFFDTIFEKLSESNTPHQIICGDFNVTIDHTLDNMNYVEPRSTRSRKKLNELMETHHFLDSYRQLNGNNKMYTWSKINGRQKARLDLSLITQGLRPFITKCDKLTPFQSDHAPLLLELDFTKFKKGRGTWRFDDSLLNDIELVSLINKTIKITCSKYVNLLGYANYSEATDPELEAFLNLDIEAIQHLDFHVDANILLEMILNDARNEIISFSVNKSRNNQNREKILLKDIQRLDNLNNSNPLITDNHADELAQKRNEYELLIQEKSGKFLMNNKISHRVEGEKASKFFCNLQKNFAAQKYIPKLIIKKNGIDTTITDQNEIESEALTYYTSLYSNKDLNLPTHSPEEFLGGDNINVPKLSTTEIESMEGKMTIDELTKALKKTNDSSSPGPSGFTYKFYKVFWNSLKFFLCKSANYSLDHEKLPPILTQGVISLLPKGDKPREYLKNWRPICLLNCGYKLISSALSSRISNVLPSIIHSDQCGFVANRYIGESIRTTYDIIHHVKQKKITALLLLLDFEKAFDSVSFRCIIETMEIL